MPGQKPDHEPGHDPSHDSNHLERFTVADQDHARGGRSLQICRSAAENVSTVA